MNSHLYFCDQTTILYETQTKHAQTSLDISRWGDGGLKTSTPVSSFFTKAKLDNTLPNPFLVDIQTISHFLIHGY